MKLAALATLIVLALPGVALAADGKAVYAAKCASCHGAAGQGSFGGPALKGVYGRKIAGLAGYAFSAGLKAKAGKWDDASLGAYLAAPAKFAPGTKMFAALPDAGERTAAIAYLKTLK